jgi:hypothetical protein
VVAIDVTGRTPVSRRSLELIHAGPPMQALMCMQREGTSAGWKGSQWARGKCDRAPGRRGTNSTPRTCRSDPRDHRLAGASRAGRTAPMDRARQRNLDQGNPDHGSLDGEMPRLRTGIFHRHPNRRGQPREASGCAGESLLPSLQNRALMVTVGGAPRRRHSGKPMGRGTRSAVMRAVFVSALRLRRSATRSLCAAATQPMSCSLGSRATDGLHQSGWNQSSILPV